MWQCRGVLLLVLLARGSDATNSTTLTTTSTTSRGPANSTASSTSPTSRGPANSTSSTSTSSAFIGTTTMLPWPKMENASSTPRAAKQTASPPRGRALVDDAEDGWRALSASPETATKAVHKNPEQEWEEYKRRNNKTYYRREDLNRMARRLRGTNITLDIRSDEDRMNMFLSRKMAIEESNKRTRSFKRALNHFADMTPQEVLTKHTGLKLAKRKPRGPPYDYRRMGRVLNTLPRSFDWREKGALTEPRNQATCGCCWAFAATAALEAKIFIRTKKLVALSEQHLLDCDTLNEKCEGGTPWDAFDWVQLNGGQEENEKYPYEVWPDKCRQDKTRMFRLQVKGYMIVRPAVEENIMAALISEGPLAVAINALTHSFQDYQEGVYSDPDCTSNEDDLHHAMVLVGFGDDDDGPYWTLRNSWGRDWGENGYIRVSRLNNLCGVMTYAVFPSIE